MTENDATKVVQADDPCEELQMEKKALSQQVKRLISAEGKLYEYQQELDAQLKEYKGLYELNRRLNGTFNIRNIFQETVTYLLQQLEFERAILFEREEARGRYRACFLDGYYDHAEKLIVSDLAMEKDDPCLLPLTTAGKEYIICKADSKEKELVQMRSKLRMNEYFIYPLRYYALPHALLAVGNSARNAGFYRRVDDGALLSMGNLLGVVSPLVENRITFEKMERAREKERVAEAKYRGIFENASEGIFQKTPEGKYLDANPALARTLGYASAGELMAEVTDVPQQLYVNPSCHDELMRLIEDHGAVEGFETQMYRKDHSVIWVSLNMRGVRDGAGRVLFYEGTVNETTEHKRAEEALRESEQKFRQLSEALEQRVKESVDELRQKDGILIVQNRQAVMAEMLSNIAHQWRQPLNMLALLAQDLNITKKREGLSDEFVDANVKKTLEIINHMSKAIDEFRYFFKPDKEKVEFRVLETMEKALSIVEGSFEVNGIRTETVKTGDPVINGYPVEFIQVLINVLINAREALIASHTDMPLVSINLLTESGKAVVTIADNAGGIPDDIKDKIFEPYFTTKGPEQGNGIGLFMCKAIIEKNMGGVLTVRNVGDGAEFRIEV
ncbi:MAG: histidine kinase [Geobacteraceae bacterium GWC2_58_44]|nr:MAG: histidine kinase [Geobacteraceae bacterium GWC2_58_44]HBG06092.1 histidine kinase [Geobacter sp.]